MDSKHLSARKVFFAALPALPMTLEPRSALAGGLLIAVVFWISTFFFAVTRLFFPQRLLKAAACLWFAALGQAVFYFWPVTPFWLISVILLMPDDLKIEAQIAGGLRQALQTGCFLLVLMMGLGVFQEVLGERFLIWIFRLPVGSLILLGIAAFVWRNQPQEIPGGET